VAARLLLLAFGVFACSTAVIIVKLSAEHPVVLAGARCLVAAAVLSPLFLRDLRRHRRSYTPAHLRRSLAPGALLGVHFISWIAGARLTPAANSSLIVNMVPLVMPLLVWATIRESYTRREAIGTALAIAGVAVMAGSDFSLDRTHFAGDVTCLVSMVFFCLYLILGRRNRDFPTVWLYLVPVYALAGLVGLATAVFVTSPFKAYPARELALIAALALVPTVIGHSVLNYSMRRLSAQTVGIANLGQILFTGAMGYLILDEAPRGSFYVAAALIASGIVATFSRPAPPPERTGAEPRQP